MKDKDVVPMMGMLVEVNAVYKREHTKENTIQWNIVSYVKPRVGWVVGVTRLQNGSVTYDNDGENGYGRGILKVTSTTAMIKVAFWPSMAPVMVSPLSCMPCKNGKPMSPSAWEWFTMRPEAQIKNAQSMRDEMKDWPRDAKGHWLKARPLIVVKTQ